MEVERDSILERALSLKFSKLDVSKSNQQPKVIYRIKRQKLIAPPYPWATERRATVHTLRQLLDEGFNKISGQVRCKICKAIEIVSYDLKEKFQEIVKFVIQGQGEWRDRDRAPKQWTDPILRTCRFCKSENSCAPILANKKRRMNWLFMFLGQSIGCATLDQLTYFCKHTKSNVHRSVSRDRMLLHTYLALCKQLDPKSPFHYQTVC